MDKKDLARNSLKSIGFVSAYVVKKQGEAAKKLELSSKAALGLTTQVVRMLPSFVGAPKENVPDNIQPATPVSSTSLSKANIEFRKSVGNFFNPKDWIIGLIAALPFLLNKEIRSNLKKYFESILENLGISRRVIDGFVGLIKGAAAIVVGVFAIKKLAQMAKVFKSLVVLANVIAGAITLLGQALALLNVRVPVPGSPGKQGAPGKGEKGKTERDRITGPAVSATGGARQPTTIPTPSKAQINKPPPSAKELAKPGSAASAQARQIQSSAAKAANAQIAGNSKLYAQLFGKKTEAVTPKTAVAATEKVQKAAPKLIDKLGTSLGNVMVGAGAALSAYDAYQRIQGAPEERDYVGAGISGTAAALQGVGLAMTLTGVGAPIGAAMIGIGAGLTWLGLARDLYNIAKPDTKDPGEDLKGSRVPDLKANVVRSEVNKGEEIDKDSNAVVMYRRAVRRKTVNINQNVDNTIVINKVIPGTPAPVSLSGSVGR